MNTPEPATSSHLLPVGTLLHGNYRVLRYLSSGGYGNTYAVVSVDFGQRLAVKEFFVKGVNHRAADGLTVRVSNSDNVELFRKQLARFRREAERIASLHNDHIVRVHDAFEEYGTAYYVMDYIDGETLEDRLTRQRHPFADDQARSVLMQLLDALRAVHAHGIWHLDLKPANVMIDSDNRVRLIDFGASKQAQSTGGSTSSSLCYTRGYAPAEQIRVQIDRFGPWTDLYALGATLYHLLSCERPPEVDSDEYSSGIFHYPDGVGEALRHIVFWLMQPSIARRPQSAQEVIDHANGMIESLEMPESPEMLESPENPDNPESPENPGYPATPAPPASPRERTVKAQPLETQFRTRDRMVRRRQHILAVICIIGALLLLAAWIFSEHLKTQQPVRNVDTIVIEKKQQ